VHSEVKEYYGKVLSGSDDLKTSACCTEGRPPEYLMRLLKNIHPEIQQRYYGCGLIAPPLMEGLRVLDLGCGTGRDCYLLSQLVGESGEVVGVDMTDEQLAFAREYEDYHREQFGYAKSNVRFLKGYIESLDELGLEAESFDLIISNCVVNLSPDKPAVLAQAHRLLKPGGEFYFSDVYADRRVPQELQSDPMIYGECLGGALYWNDFINLSKAAGFLDPRLVEDRPLTIEDESIAKKLKGIQFFSATYRLFKLMDLEPACEDYGQAVIYRGTIEQNEAMFALDKHHHIEAGRIFPVCGNTYRMLEKTRFADHFDRLGHWGKHYGIFEGCGMVLPFVSEASETSGCC